MKNNKTNSPYSVLIGAVILSVLIFIAGCSKNIKHETFEDMVTNAKSKVNTITVEDYKIMSEHGKSYEIIDCRQADDFIKSHIPDAINIPRGILEFSDKISNRRTIIFIYNYSDDCSALCAETLLKLKYHNVTMIENGWNGWSKAYPKIFETGSEKSGNDPIPKKEESSGCGG